MDGRGTPRGSLGSVSSLTSITSIREGAASPHCDHGSVASFDDAGDAGSGRDGVGASARDVSHHAAGSGSERRARRARDRTSSGTVAPSLDADQALDRVGFGAFHIRLTLVAGCFWVRACAPTQPPPTRGLALVLAVLV